MVDLRFSETELDERITHIRSFIADQVSAAGADGAVLGLSGGVDSSLVAYLAVDALGADSVRGLILPGAPSSDASKRDAQVVADELEISVDTIDIEPIVEQAVTAVPDSPETVAVGNARARVRAVINYLIANDDNRLVLGTGNRSEALTGYYTKYGDGAVDCHPLGNLYKTQVWQLAEAVGVPARIINKPPSAELWADQTDESELGIDYQTLDSILALHVEGPLSIGATARTLDVSMTTIDDVVTLYEQSAHKRAMPPAPPARD